MKYEFIRFLQSCLLLTGVTLTTATQNHLNTSANQPNKTAKRPNVLFIARGRLTPELGCYGNTILRTWNFDKLSADSTVCITLASSDKRTISEYSF